MSSRNTEEHPEGESSYGSLRIPAAAQPSSYDFGHPSGENAIAEVENWGRERSSSFSRFRQAGGPNSIDNFARSWQRAACFPEVIPRRSSFVSADTDDELAIATGIEYGSRSSQSWGRASDVERPLLSDDSDREELGEEGNHGTTRSRGGIPSAGLLASSFERSFATSYGTISSRVSEATRRHAIQFHREQQQAVGDGTGDPDREPLLLKHIEHEDGTHEDIIIGQSTVPQTIFNSVNVLIGIGLLSLPLAMKHAGWVLGLLFLVYSAVTTSYTAKILAKCLDVDKTLVTYADLAYISFGHHARLVTSFLFCLELLGACVALVVLFADSLYALVPSLSILQWKIVCGVVLVPLNFLPLRFLSVTSILGIISCTSIVILICVDGLIKPHSPGSLQQPAKTFLFPENWATLPLSFGLIMSPWGGHGVFPNIYRDMRHPKKYGKSLWATYLFTFSLDCSMAIIGWFMFGDIVRDEITANILTVSDYPQALSVCIIIFISIIPLTKVPLNARPLVATFEVLCGVNMGRVSADPRSGRRTEVIQQFIRVAVRIFTVALIVVLSIVFPSFDRIMAFLGSFLCFTICIIFPLAFYLKIFGDEISRRERILDWFLLITSCILATIGTVWAFLPREMISES
ncbi:Vacuolar amino acid transporter 1 [Penicillium macrosclerotiorum]|uniref:Vacuolar amino acid transporter 1 n=1 Tax=Penicillium macrosclerotiorum TaxID=303699 RepID=UPI00254746B0|nr:Vacuolar amino acid transporter 1 [Penicillium macrosclerotiorum]KAJ5693351.1 Vacuolar amino acid transporter 1 [Penicillium macrosclerotiorum]